MMLKIGIGTAQFGLNYGITNLNGIVEESEVRNILNDNFYSYIDTACSYGVSEKIIGKNLLEKNKKIITKIILDEKNICDLESNFTKSLKKLNREKIFGLLLHNTSDLSSKSKIKFIEELKKLKDSGMVQKIGISIYNSFDLDDINLDSIDIVQAPLSIYDQRLLSNDTLSNIYEKGILIHIRSIFLQGLILQKPELWPKNPKLISLKKHHEIFWKFLEANNLSPISICMKFISGLQKIDAAIFGISSLSEYKEIKGSFLKEKGDEYKIDFSSWAYKSKEIDPRYW